MASARWRTRDRKNSWPVPPAVPSTTARRARRSSGTTATADLSPASNDSAEGASWVRRHLQKSQAKLLPLRQLERQRHDLAQHGENFNRAGEPRTLYATRSIFFRADSFLPARRGSFYQGAFSLPLRLLRNRK